MLLQVNAVSRTRFELGRITETQRTKHRSNRTRAANGTVQLTEKLNLITLFALVNRNAQAGVNPNPGTD